MPFAQQLPASSRMPHEKAAIGSMSSPPQSRIEAFEQISGDRSLWVTGIKTGMVTLELKDDARGIDATSNRTVDRGSVDTGPGRENCGAIVESHAAALNISSGKDQCGPRSRLLLQYSAYAREVLAKSDKSIFYFRVVRCLLIALSLAMIEELSGYFHSWLVGRCEPNLCFRPLLQIVGGIWPAHLRGYPTGGYHIAPHIGPVPGYGECEQDIVELRIGIGLRPAPSPFRP